MDGRTPLAIASLPVGEWLILNGALSPPPPRLDHVAQDIAMRDICPEKRPALLAWAQKAATSSASFFDTVLMGTFHPEGTASTTALLRRTLTFCGSSAPQVEVILKHIPDDLQRDFLLQKLRPVPALTRLRGQAGALELIADFQGGVLRGRALQNTREAARVLAALRSAGRMVPGCGKGRLRWLR